MGKGSGKRAFESNPKDEVEKEVEEVVGVGRFPKFGDFAPTEFASDFEIEEAGGGGAVVDNEGIEEL